MNSSEKFFAFIGGMVMIFVFAIVWGMVVVGGIWGFVQAYNQDSTKAIVWAVVAALSIIFYQVAFLYVKNKS